MGGCTVSPSRRQVLESRPCLSPSQGKPRHLDQCLARNKCSINVCRPNSRPCAVVEQGGRSLTLATTVFTEGHHTAQKREGAWSRSHKVQARLGLWFRGPRLLLFPPHLTRLQRPSVLGLAPCIESHMLLICVGGNSWSPASGFCLPRGLFVLWPPGEVAGFFGGWAV